MARHNEARLLGYLIDEPGIKYADIEKTKMVRVTIRVRTLRGLRDFGTRDRRKDYDEHTVISQNESLMGFMAHLHANDVVDIKGNVITPKIRYSMTCPNCKASIIRIDSPSLINPIFMNYVSTKDEFAKMDPNNEKSIIEKVERFLRKRTEISNNITVIGKCVRAPEEFNEKGLIVNYALEVPRKYRIKEDDVDHRRDYLQIKCYGKIAENDYKYIREGSRVFIDGFIMSRNYQEECTCEACGHKWLRDRSKNEIVPYSVEYLSECNDGYKEINNELDEGV